MATGMNHELYTLHNNESAITDSVANQASPGWLSLKLREKGMISAEMALTTVNNTSLSNEDKVDRLVQAVESKLRHGLNPAQIFQEFVKILQSEPALQDLAQKLKTEYYDRRIPRSEDEPENGDTEESKLIHMEEGRRDLQGQTQNEQEWRSHQTHESRCPQPRCDNRCFLFTCCCGVLIVITVLILIKAKIDVHLRLNRNTENQITSSLPYGISREDKLHIKQELVLWLSCFIICAPWILIQYISKPLVAGFCFLVTVGILFLLKDSECFILSELLLPAYLSSVVILPIVFHLWVIRHLCKHFHLRLFVVLLLLTVGVLYAGVTTAAMQHIIKQNQHVEQQWDRRNQHINQEWDRNQHIDQEWDRNQHVEPKFNYISGAIGLVSSVLASLVPQAIFSICADKALFIYRHRTMYMSSLYLPIFGAVTTCPLFIALLLTVSPDAAALFASLILLLTNLVLLTATILVKHICVPTFKYGSRGVKLPIV